MVKAEQPDPEKTGLLIKVNPADGKSSHPGFSSFEEELLDIDRRLAALELQDPENTDPDKVRDILRKLKEREQEY